MAISITNVVAGQFEKKVLPTVVPDAAATVPSVSAGSASALSTISNGALNALSGIATLKNKKWLKQKQYIVHFVVATVMR